MPKPIRNGTCATCDGKVRHYPDPAGVGPGAWAHLDPGDWIDTPHDPDPTPESLEAAGI